MQSIINQIQNINGPQTLGYITSSSTTLTGYNSSITMSNGEPGIISARDVHLDGVSVKLLLETITSRLAILVPDPDKLAKFEALKEAYDHYKLLEKLCSEPDK